MPAIHSILPAPLTLAVDEVTRSAGLQHVAHGDIDPVSAARTALSDPDVCALIGPCRSRAVAEAIEVTAPRRVPLFAPVATWVGVTRDDEPGSEHDHVRHLGTVFRMVARDSVVARAIVSRVRHEGHRCLLLAGDHEYGDQLARQLRWVGLASASETDATLIVLAALAGDPENVRARALAPLPVLAFDGVQGEVFPKQRVEMANPYAPSDSLVGVVESRRAAELVVRGLQLGGDLLDRIRELGPFDAHGDLVGASVRFERLNAPHRS